MSDSRRAGAIIDADSHLVEMPDLWVDHTDSANKHLALTFGRDELGYDCIYHKGRLVMECHLTIPGDRTTQGAFSERRRTGEPAPFSVLSEMPPHYWNPAARRDFVADWGADGTILFPNWSLTWPRSLRDDVESIMVNMAAWNRWAVTVAQEGGGRLFPVGEVVLDDPAWAEAQLRALAAGGIRVVKVPQGLAGDKRPSHPDLDRVWSLFEDLGIAVAFHIGAHHNRPMDVAWTDDDHAADRAPLLSFAMIGMDVQLTLADLILHGVLERHPRLRIGVMEIMASWVPLFLRYLDDAGYGHKSFTGRSLVDLPLKPSEYFRRQVRLGAFAAERPGRMIDQMGPLLMFGGDFPHSEGEPSMDAYRRKLDVIPAEHEDAFFGENARFILGL